MGTLIESLSSGNRLGGSDMKIMYPVIFTQTKDERDTYLIEIPDLKPIASGVTEGFGLADAIEMARDYIGCTLYDKEDSEIPAASDIKDIDIGQGEFYHDGESIVSIVDIDIDVYRRRLDNRAVRKNVSIPAWMDVEAKRKHLNLSRLLQEALKEKLVEV